MRPWLFTIAIASCGYNRSEEPPRTVPSACAPEFTVITPNRTLPGSYRSQALASLGMQHPNSRIMLDRPFSSVGSVAYVLVAYRDDARSAWARITGVAVTAENDYAWRFDADCAAADLPEGLLVVMERLSRLVAPIVGPLRPDMLERGRFVAFTLLWQVSVPGGDPIVFRPGGGVVNARAGLSGRWAVTSDTTLTIGDRVFHLRKKEGDLVSPVQLDANGRGIAFWIERAGATPPEQRY